MRKVASVFVAVLVALAVLPMTGSAQPRQVRSSGSDVRQFDPKEQRDLVTTNATAREAKTLGADAAAPPEVGE